MPEVVIYLIEIAVGMACLVAAWGARRRAMIMAAIVLALAGAAAVLHGLGAMASQ